MFPKPLQGRDFRERAYQCQHSIMLLIVLVNEQISLELRRERFQRLIVPDLWWRGSRFDASGADTAKQSRLKSGAD